MTSRWEYDSRHSFPFEVLISHWHWECTYVDKMPLSSAEAVSFIIRQQARMTMCGFVNRNHMGYKMYTKAFFQNWSRISCFNWDVWNTDVEVWMEPAVGLHTLNCLKICNVFVCAKERLVHIKAACAYRMHWRIIHQHVMIVQTCGQMRMFRLDWPFESVI